MECVWDERKNQWLQDTRSISFQEIAEILEAGNFHLMKDNSARAGQKVFIVTIRSYTWVVPFVVDDQERIVLKTAFPSRKEHKRYGK